GLFARAGASRRASASTNGCHRSLGEVAWPEVIHPTRSPLMKSVTLHSWRPWALLLALLLGPVPAWSESRAEAPKSIARLFATAGDVSNFCRMVLAEGVFEGKRYLSREAVRQMTSSQTGDLPASYGLGWGTGKKPGSAFGHGGAFSTNMRIDPQKQLVLVLLL